MTKRIALPALGSVAALLAAPAHADDFQQWVQLGAKVDIGEKVLLSDEIVARFSDDRNGLYEIENALLVGYRLSNTVTAWAGYVHNPTYTAGDFAVMERRAREQLTIDNFARLGGASLSARLRVEQRWRDGIDGTGWRARPYLRLAVPLGDSSAPTLNLFEEAFVNLNTTPFQAQDGLERLRTAATLSVPVGKTLKLEVGYLNQHRFVAGGPDTDDHALTASAALSF